MIQGLPQFYTVLTHSLAEPLKLSTLGIGVVVGLIVPSAIVIVVPLSLITVGLLVWQDLSDDTYLQQILKLQSKQVPFLLPSTIKQLISLVEQEIPSSNKEPEVQKDLLSIREILLKTQTTITNISLQRSSHIVFIEKFLPPVLDRLIALSRQELVARNYLRHDNSESIMSEILDLDSKLAKTTDPQGQKEYTQAINLKKEQLEATRGIEQKLQRIDSSIAKIQAVLEQSNTYLIKLTLSDNTSNILDEGEILTESLRQLQQIDD